MDIRFIIGISLTTCLLTLIIKKYNESIAFAVAISGGIILLIGLLFSFSEVSSKIMGYSLKFGINNSYISVMIKSLALCYITEFAADLCRDFGQSALAGKVELLGKCTILIMTLPLLGEILELAVSYVESV